MTFGDLGQMLPANYTRRPDLPAGSVPAFTVFNPERVPLSYGGPQKALTAQFDFDSPASGTVVAEKGRGLTDMQVLRNWSGMPDSLAAGVVVDSNGQVTSAPSRFLTPAQEKLVKANWSRPTADSARNIVANPAAEAKMLFDLPYDRSTISGIGVATGRENADRRLGTTRLMEFANDNGIPFVDLHDQLTLRASSRMDPDMRAAEIANRLLAPNFRYQEDAKGGETADDVDDFISELGPDTDLGDLLEEIG